MFYAVRHQADFGPALFSMYVVMPAVAVTMAALFDRHPAVQIALITLSVSPVPPILPKKVLKAGGGEPYTCGLLVAVSVLAVVWTPLVLEIIGWTFAVSLHISPLTVTRIVFLTVLLPLGIGVWVRERAPDLAERIVRVAAAIATTLLIVGSVPVLFGAWGEVVALVGNGTILAFLAFTLIGLAAGHLLGGPNDGNRSVLALFTATRHPGVALAIASANFPGVKLVVAAVLLSLVVNGITSLPYLAWRRRAEFRAHAGAPP